MKSSLLRPNLFTIRCIHSNFEECIHNAAITPMKMQCVPFIYITAKCPLPLPMSPATPGSRSSDVFSCRLILPVLELHLNGIVPYVRFCLTSSTPNNILGFISTVACIRNSLPFMAEDCSVVWFYHSLPVNLLVDFRVLRSF